MTHAATPSTRDRIVQTAERIILARGYPGTTVDEICAAADVSKGSFYHHFETKEALGLAVLDAYYERGITRLLEGPFMAESHAIRRCLGLLDHAESIAEDVWADGCILGTYAVDLAEANPHIHHAVSKRLRELAEELTPVFRDALAESPRDGEAIAADALADQFLATVEGAIVLSKAHGDPDRITGGIRTLRTMLQGYLAQ